MNKLVVASLSKSAGKTSVILGLAKALHQPFGYLKPFGDRMVHREKKAWDYDADLILSVFGIQEDPEELTLGFDHSKLRYMYDAESRGEKLRTMVHRVGKEILFIEGGRDLRYGVSIGLDPLSVSRDIGAKMLLVLHGNEDTLLDDVMFLKQYVHLAPVTFKGVVLNKVQDLEEFKAIHLRKMEENGIPILGILPYEKELTYMTVGTIARRLFARVITGENALDRVVKNMSVGAMSVGAFIQTTFYDKASQLLITSGDRADMILAAIEGGATCLVLTNNIVPSSNIISKAYEHQIPLLLVPHDTYTAATQISQLEPLLTKSESGKIDRVTQLVEKHVNIKAIMEG
jgi:BioD-like phosphotransacetylase family protein